LYHGFGKIIVWRKGTRNEEYNEIFQNPGTNKMYTEKPCYECFVTYIAKRKYQDFLSTSARCHATNDAGKKGPQKTSIEFPMRSTGHPTHLLESGRYMEIYFTVMHQ